MIDIAIILTASFCLCYLISHNYFYKHILNQSGKSISKDYFSIIFAFSNIILLIIVIEIIDKNIENSNKHIWRIIFKTYIIIMYYIFPLFAIISITLYRKNNNFIQVFLINKFKNLLVITTLSLLYFIFSNTLFNYIKHSVFFPNIKLFINLDNITEYIGLVSIFVSAFMSSYGSVQLICNSIYYPFFKSKHYCNIFHDKIERLKGIIYQLKLNNIEFNIKSDSKTTILDEENFPCYNKTFKLSTDNNAIDKYNKEVMSLSTNSGTIDEIKNSKYLKVISEDSNYENLNSQTKELLFFKKELELELKIIIEKNRFNKVLNNEIYYLDYHSIEEYIKNINSENKYNNICTSSSFNLKFKLIKIGKIVLGFYSIYKVVNTLRNLCFSDYNNINCVLKEEALNIIDLIVQILVTIFQTSFSEIYYTIIEQYIGLIIVSTVIVINIKSFLNLLQLIYLKTSKLLSFATNKNNNIQVLFLGYTCCLFYIASSIMLINNLPVSYRSNIAKLYGNVDFSLFKYSYDIVYIIFVIVFTITEYLLFKME